MAEYDARNREIFVKKLMGTVKDLRELLGRLPIDFDQNKVGRTKEILIQDVDFGMDEKVMMREIQFEIEDVGHDPTQSVCRLICRREDVVTIYSVVMREYDHMGARDGEFSDAFWASAKLDEESNLVMINGMVLPAVTTDGLRLIPTDQQLDPDRRAAKVDVADLDKIGKIVEAVRNTLPPKVSEVGGVALRLVE